MRSIIDASSAQALHQDAWKRTTSTFLPISARESNVPDPSRSVSVNAGAEGGAARAGAADDTSTSVRRSARMRPV